MTERPSFRDGVQRVWDSTSLSLAMKCPKLYEYRMIRSIVSNQTKVDLLFGGLYASALEHFYKYRTEGATIDEALERVVRETLVKTWTPTGPVAFPHETKTRMNLIRTIVWYIDEFAEETEDTPKTHILQNGKPAVELSFTLEMSADILYAGHLDRVVDYGGGLYWMDQKTTGKTLGQFYIDQFTPDNQFTGYTWAGKTILHSPIRGGIVDAAQIAVGFTRFARFFVSRGEDEIDEWISDVKETVHRTQEYTARGSFPRNRTACFNCEYRKLCSVPPRMRETFMQSDYHLAEHWEPAVPR